jgi:hypothetical protein
VEDFSRRVLVALAAGAAGPAAALVTLLVVAPSLVMATTPDAHDDVVETTGSLLVGLMIGSLFAVAIAFAAAVAATLVAFRLTRCPRAVLAWVVCLAATPAWFGALAAMDLSTPAYLALAGMLPAAVRLAFGYAPESGSYPISRTS